ncbi:DUF3995 domain-containing protein [Bacillus sp. 03113]|uniref:DUF3995 domain-containing protein n=1 Tax=Bacillus sp. 03113 TaxID=2578211 RepID=UPI0011440156|nr:DUF3995 domain-containing protein [Bacillus sp. 03113]
MELFIMISTVVLLCLISLLHFYWAFGGTFGIHAVLPSKERENDPAFIPGVFPTIVVAILLLH